MKKMCFLFIACALVFFRSQVVLAATDTADALITILQQIAIAKVNDLQFDQKYQGDASATVAPSDAGAASFTVTGISNAAYNVILPANGTVDMALIGGSNPGAPEETIHVTNFTHDGGANPVITGGSVSLKVGATHDAILANQTPGNYSGTFTVEVTY